MMSDEQATVHDSTHVHDQSALPPIKIALVLDNMVADVLSTDERLASIFLSEPLVIEITGNEHVIPGDEYDPSTGVFSHGPRTARFTPADPVEPGSVVPGTVTMGRFSE